MSVQEVPQVAEAINFPETEEKILNFWKENDVFRTWLKQSEGKPKYTFYDGPPFSTGFPHYGHILVSTIKDVLTRYFHQQGFHVERRFGWDTHCLAVEFEVDKALNIKGPDEVMKMGIDKYNAECRKIVMRYAKEWETIIGRIGRWIDFQNDYKTLYPWFMESVWWIFKQLYQRNLVYQGNKVMPYSTACKTPLSNFESGQNYKDVIDPVIVVSLQLINYEKGAELLVWTSTPWTLPSNLGACVNAHLLYVLLTQISTRRRFILLGSKVETVFQPDDYKIIKRIPGIALRGLRYKPIFSYFKNMAAKAFRVLTDDHVTAESGGVVPLAPYFGEDDYRCCLQADIITKDQDPICPVDASGRFVMPVKHFQGMYVKDADKAIINHLKAQGRLIYQTEIKHTYPHCWRSDTPLIYRAVPSWFIRVEKMTQELQKASSEISWVPNSVKDKQFRNWLREASDWAVSRNGYWGTPIPIWMSPKGDEIVCVGSIAELEELTGQKITDLHRESIDHLEIPSKIPGNPPLKRVPDVFDCWFESGSMPYGQKHYPFKNLEEFAESFPADFIAEGIDQINGWFYTLLVISAALFEKAPYKNVITNGLVLTRDGQKMSKRKKNYPDPLEIVGKYGADALRLYLINSPVVRTENLRFKEEGVRNILTNVFSPWYNAFRFLFQSIENYVQSNNECFFYSETEVTATGNIMDQWILSFTQSLLDYVRKEMTLYHLYNVVPRLTKFIYYLTNWYVRMNIRRLRGEGGKTDCKAALLTLFDVLLNIVKMMAPFTPFLSETMYSYLKELMKSRVDSVHYLMLPEPNKDFINLDIERAVSRMQSVIKLGRVVRDRKAIPIKCPLPEVIVIHQDPQYIADVLSLKEYIHLDLNVREINTTTDKSKYGITVRAEPNSKVLGARLKQDFETVTRAIQSLTDEEINDMVKAGYAMIAGQRIEASEVKLIFKFKSVNTSQYEVNSDNDVLILLNVTADSSMQDEGTAREIINRVQELRKKAHLVPTDQVSVFYKANGDLDRVATSFTSFIENTLKASFRPLAEKRDSDQIIIDEVQTLKNCNLQLVLTQFQDVTFPNFKCANLELVDLTSRSPNASVLLEDDEGKPIDLLTLKSQVFSLFEVQNFKLVDRMGQEITEDKLMGLSGQTIFIIPTDKEPSALESYGMTPKNYKDMINEWIKATCKGQI